MVPVSNALNTMYAVYIGDFSLFFIKLLILLTTDTKVMAGTLLKV